MTSKIIIFCTSIALFGLTSCANHEHGDSSKQEVKSTDNEHVEDIEEVTEEITLNNGQKWVVNEEMKPSVAEGEQALSTYLSSGNSDYKSLAAQLKIANNGLISSCTMEGASHDELHKWLHPHLELVAELQNADNQEDAVVVIEKLSVSYENYHTYFQ